MKHKKILIIAVMFVLVLASVLTYMYINRETDVTYQGTFVNCAFDKKG
ncbi:hypothetical protein SH1V18_04720 [Vallitalea longa]|uniref:Uncharacterized protein n=1 Tax=Vallitalea longa TaxID=2936439 RepID=A0A9W6DE41_9FIRM|nr:hypothetical protein [Vallitalea longa]GKX27992.1 hypothetical protein SH1V18_04720 [Vallitalea longa]